MEWLYGTKEAEITENEIYISKIYTKGEMLGQGNFGKVFVGINKRTNGKVAIKVCNLPTDEAQRAIWKKQEVENHISIGQNEYIVNLIAAWIQNDQLFVVLEKYGQNLRDYVEINGRQNEEFLWNVIIDGLNGLNAVHKRRLIHDDVHAANFLLSESMDQCMKLCDFGKVKQGNIREDLSAFGLMVIQLGLNREMERDVDKAYWHQQMLRHQGFIGFGHPMRKFLAWLLHNTAPISTPLMLHIAEKFYGREFDAQRSCGCSPYQDYFCMQKHRLFFRSLTQLPTFDMAYAARSCHWTEGHSNDIFRQIIRDMFRNQQ